MDAIECLEVGEERHDSIGVDLGGSGHSESTSWDGTRRRIWFDSSHD